jgi:glycerol-3-phosphate dehydrogenase subunit C
VSFSRPVQAASRVAYFAGCFELFNEPHVGRAAVRVLEALGCRVLVPEQRCCGIPKISAGDAAGAVADMRANLDILAPLVQAGWTVTSGCPSCLLTLVEDYPDMAVEDDRARRVAAAVRDVHVLIEELAAGEGARALFGAAAAPWRGKRLAYHAPCHLRAAGRGLQPKRLLERLLGIEFAAVTDTCCGMGGTFGLKARHADLSRAIAEPVLEKVRAAGAEAVVTSCGMCRTQLAHGTGLPAYHPLEILAGALAPKGAETAAL